MVIAFYILITLTLISFAWYVYVNRSTNKAAEDLVDFLNTMASRTDTPRVTLIAAWRFLDRVMQHCEQTSTAKPLLVQARLDILDTVSAELFDLMRFGWDSNIEMESRDSALALAQRQLRWYIQNTSDVNKAANAFSNNIQAGELYSHASPAMAELLYLYIVGNRTPHRHA